MDAIGNSLQYKKDLRSATVKINGKISINNIAVIQYLLIYILIQYIGGRLLSALGSYIFYGSTLLICALIFIAMPKRVALKQSFYGSLVLLAFSLILSFAITGGALSVGTILSILSRFILVYVAIKIDVDNFLPRFLRLVFLMAVISLIEFLFVQIVGQSASLRFFSHLYRIRNGNAYLGDSYGLFFFCYNFMDAGRNAYMFGEPGEYQSVIITALYFLTFFEIELSKKTKIIYSVIFIITLMTIQSTTGFFNLFALVIAVLISKKKSINANIRKIIWLFVVVLILYMIFGYSENSFLYTNFFSKIMSGSGSLDFSVNTGAARTGPVGRFIETVNTVPEKLIFGVGFDGLTDLPLKGYSTTGLINFLAMTGVFSSLIMLWTMGSSLVRTAKSFWQIALALFIVINMGMSQPDILAISSVLICMYGTYSAKVAIDK